MIPGQTAYIEPPCTCSSHTIFTHRKNTRTYSRLQSGRPQHQEGGHTPARRISTRHYDEPTTCPRKSLINIHFESWPNDTKKDSKIPPEYEYDAHSVILQQSTFSPFRSRTDKNEAHKLTENEYWYRYIP